MAGKKFGQWTVLGRDKNTKHSGRQMFWRCRCVCGTHRSVVGQSLRNGASSSCGCGPRKPRDMKGPKNPRWKGGRRVNNAGYVFVYCPGHPRAQANKVREHILVMEARLGRHLRPGEEVHHKNGLKGDNSDSNLELWLVSQPRGQRVEDLIEFSLNILATYSPSKLTGRKSHNP